MVSVISCLQPSQHGWEFFFFFLSLLCVSWMGRKVGICLASHIHAVKFGIIPTSQMGKLRCRCWRESSLAVPLSQFCFCPSDGQAPCSTLWSDGGALRVILSKVSQGRLLSRKLNLGRLSQFSGGCYHCQLQFVHAYLCHSVFTDF